MPSDPHDARMGRAFALVLDREGRGHVVEVLVVLAAGSGDVWTPQPMGPEVQASAQLAIAAALGGAVVHSSVRWQVRAACDHLLLLRAVELLARPDLDVAEVALACGYETSSSFTRLFHAELGEPPATWRRRHSADAAPVLG